MKKSNPIAIIVDGEVRCPRCGAKLGEAEHGAFCHAIKVFCRSRTCRVPVKIEVPHISGQ